MPIRFNNTEIEGLLPIDEYIPADNWSAKEIVELIIQRLDIYT